MLTPRLGWGRQSRAPGRGCDMLLLLLSVQCCVYGLARRKTGCKGAGGGHRCSGSESFPSATPPPPKSCSLGGLLELQFSQDLRLSHLKLQARHKRDTPPPKKKRSAAPCCPSHGRTRRRSFFRQEWVKEPPLKGQHGLWVQPLLGLPETVSRLAEGGKGLHGVSLAGELLDSLLPGTAKEAPFSMQ